MAQTFPPYCPRCGKPTVAGQRFCAHCGQVMQPLPTSTSKNTIDNPNILTQVAHSDEPMQPIQPIQPIQPAHQLQPTQPSRPQSYSQPDWSPASPVSSPPPFLPASPSPILPARRRRSRIGLFVTLLIVLLLIGVGSYIAITVLGIHIGGAGGGSQPPITTTPLNTTVTYAGVNLTIVNAQQAESFVNDPNSASNGMVRITIQEQNPTTSKVSWLYSDMARLLLPGKKVAAPTFVKAKVGIAPGATQTSLVDFAVPDTDKLSQLTLQLGTSSEVQMNIPLIAHADVSKYAPKSVKPDGQMLYFGLNYTLTTATSQLSIAGQQASKGMVYVVVTLQVDNTLSQVAIPGSAYDYIRLQTGNVTVTPKDTTLPVSFDTGETGKTGTVTFLVPQSNAFTLLLLPQGQNGAKQASTDFQFS
ncbi:MAG TPA: zinc ribbon domain-containing protein [Ktedonobacteraceae bacterium]|nr:zinc ribbon domain-containing protein [Ktedonobacteraceae bacterium]